jgi:hypothetical protein
MDEVQRVFLKSTLYDLHSQASSMVEDRMRFKLKAHQKT